MHKLEIKLKQHTPLIHFQHDQEGATLRASEVKPKLDKFIIETDFGNDFEKCKSLLMGFNPKKPNELRPKFNEGYRALNYKIRIEVSKKADSVKLQSESSTNSRGERKFYSFWRKLENGRTEEFPLLLSNMGGKDNELELMNFSLYEDVKMTITCLEEEISDALAYWIDVFFAKNNFGQRSSKGFGSFSVLEVNGEKKNFPAEELDSHYMQFKLSETNPLFFQYKLFQTIDFYWKCLKSGVNYTQYNRETREYRYPNRYIKAFLWTYLNQKNQTWEKRSVKQSFNLTTGREKPENPNPVSFARAVLGCPDKFEYRSMGKTVTIAHNEDSRSTEFIARVPAPIIFKPIVNGTSVKVYLLVDESAINELKRKSNKQFVFKCQSRLMTLDVNPDVVNVKELIKQYHQHIKRCRWGFENRDRDYENFIERYDLDGSIWFVPLDFNWRKVIDCPVILK